MPDDEWVFWVDDGDDGDDDGDDYYGEEEEDGDCSLG